MLKFGSIVRKKREVTALDGNSQIPDEAESQDFIIHLQTRQKLDSKIFFFKT